MSVSDKKKLFESAMEEHLKPSPKTGWYSTTFLKKFYHNTTYYFNISFTFSFLFLEKVFSFLSQDEVEKMKQEEGSLLINFHFKLYNVYINNLYNHQSWLCTSRKENRHFDAGWTKIVGSARWKWRSWRFGGKFRRSG